MCSWMSWHVNMHTQGCVCKLNIWLVLLIANPCANSEINFEFHNVFANFVTKCVILQIQSKVEIDCELTCSLASKVFVKRRIQRIKYPKRLIVKLASRSCKLIINKLSVNCPWLNYIIKEIGSNYKPFPNRDSKESMDCLEGRTIESISHETWYEKCKQSLRLFL